MCKHADNPCPGCRKHRQSEAPLMFFTEEERRALEASNKTPMRDSHP